MSKIQYFIFFFFANLIFIKAQNYQLFDELLRKGSYSEAKHFFENNIYQPNNQDSTYLYYFIRSSALYSTLEQVPKADSMLTFITPSLTAYPKTHFLQGTLLAEKANVLLKQRKMPEALEKMQQAEQILSDFPSTYIFLLINKSIVFIQTGKLVEAENALQTAKLLAEKNSLSSLITYPKIFHLLGNIGLMKSDVQEAEKNFSYAAELLKTNFSTSNLDFALTNYSLANLYLATGRYEQSEQSAQVAMPLFEKIIGKNSPYYAYCLSVLGRAYYLNNKEEKAELALKNAIAVFEKTVGTKHPDYGAMLGSLANLYKKIKRYDESEVYFLKAKDLLAQTVGTKNNNYYITLGNLAKVYAATQQYEKAVPFFETVLGEGEAVLGKNNDKYLAFKYAFANMLTEQGKYERAFTEFQAANAIQKFFLSNYLNFLSEDDRVDYYKTVESNFENFNMLAMAYPKPAVLQELLELRLYSKGLLLNENQRIIKNILNTDNQSIKENYQTFFDLKKQLAKCYALSPAQLAAAKINIDELEEKTNALEKKLVQASQTFSDWQSTQNQSTEAIFKNLKNDESAIEIIRFREQQYDDLTDKIFYNYLIINKKDNVLTYSLLTQKNGKTLENAQYENYYLEATKRNGNVSLMQELGNIFWKNMDNELVGKKKIYLSPDGIYHKINLETLQNQDGKYLNEQYSFVILTNLKEIAAQSEKLLPENPTAILIGNPAYDLQNLKQYDLPEGWESASTRSFELKPNPYTQKEVTAIHKILTNYNWKSALYVKNEAKEEVLKNMTQSPTLLHIASHGYYLEDARNKSNFPLSNTKNPLLHSMLFLSGAQNTLQNKKINEEDGIFTAYEMANLDLRQTELVVLSACHTGLGKIKNGEGVYGLQRAVMSAGAKSLIISLWEVDDKATQLLMTHFYSFWTAGNDKHVALKKAQAEVKLKYPQPFYWGGFILIGQ
jgi:CHAT domain-containing protein